MRCQRSRSVFTLLMIILALIPLIIMTRSTNAKMPDQMNLNDWTTVSGSPQVDFSDNPPNPPSLRIGDSIPGDTTFGKGADSLFLSNPVTINFQDGTISFDIYFDNDPGSGDRAVITFRMQDPNNYYGAMLSNTHNWNCTFIIVKDGRVKAIGTATSLQFFHTRLWEHVSLVIKGSQFTALKDSQPIFSANDSSWGEGKWGGVGICSAYYGGVFHIDTFGIEDTSNPLTYRAPFTSVVTSVVTSVLSSFTTTSFTETSTSITTTVSTTTSTSSQIIVNPVISNVISYNTTLVSAYVPVMDYPTLVFLLAVGFLIGVIDIHEYEKGAMVVLTTVISSIVIAYVFYLQERILPYLGLFATALIAGILVKLARRRQRCDDTYSQQG